MHIGISTGMTGTIRGWMSTMATMTGNIIGKTTLRPMKSTFSTWMSTGGKSTTMHIGIGTGMTGTIRGWMSTMATMTGNIIGKTTLRPMKSTFSTWMNTGTTFTTMLGSEQHTNNFETTTDDAYWDNFFDSFSTTPTEKRVETLSHANFNT